MRVKATLAIGRPTMNLEFLVRHALWKCLYRHAAKLAARRYIAEHFQPSPRRHTRSVYAWKHDFERATDRYITEDDFADSFRHCGFKVADGKVFAKETNPWRRL